MKTKPLIETNPYLKDPEMRARLNARFVRSSCGVEGIKPPTSTTPIVIKDRERKLYEELKARLSAE